MIQDSKELDKVLYYEYRIYATHMFPTPWREFIAAITHNPIYRIWIWQKWSRKHEYYKARSSKTHGIFRAWYSLLRIYSSRRRNILGEKLGLEIYTEKIGKGLRIDHYNNVINGNAIIGENCHLLGNVCIGNKGAQKQDTPIIGNNVLIGRGAIIIGGISIADNITIAAGSLVNKSFLNEGVTIAGVPAKEMTVI